MTQSSASPQSRLYVMVDSALGFVEWLMAIVAAGILLCVMVLVTLDAVLRYGFAAPLRFQYTLTQDYLLIAIILLAMPWGYRTGGYIRITGIAQLFPVGLRNMLFRAGLLASFLLVVGLFVSATEKFLKLWSNGETAIGVVDLPIYLSWICLPIGLGLLALRLFMITIGPAANLHIEHDPTEEI